MLSALMNHSTNTQRKFSLWASLCADLLKAPSICLDILKRAWGVGGFLMFPSSPMPARLPRLLLD